VSEGGDATAGHVAISSTDSATSQETAISGTGAASGPTAEISGREILTVPVQDPHEEMEDMVYDVTNGLVDARIITEEDAAEMAAGIISDFGV
jgi:hypothetical protein